MVTLILILLQVKHWWVDFVNQSIDEVRSKSHYGDILGIYHSAKHGLLTTVIFYLALDPLDAVFIGLVDFVAHYHIDWAKMNWGNRDINNPKFWNHLGLDQMAHQIVYIGLILIAAYT